jgi:hypothetical protein
MNIRVTLEAVITLPEGTQWPSFGDIGSREFTLPNGDTVKPWIVLEWNDMDDLSTTQAEAMSIDINNTDCTIEAAGWAS